MAVPMPDLRQVSVRFPPPVHRPHPVDELLAANRNRDALEQSEALLVAEPGRAKYHRFRFHALSGLRRFDEALAAIEQALTLQPDNALYRRLRAGALRSAGRAGQAIAALEPLLAKRPDDPEVLGCLCDCHFRQGRVELAREFGRRRLAVLAAQAEPAAPSGSGSTLAASLMPPRPHAGTRDRVAFALWGDARTYCEGAIANARLLPTVYPGWQGVFFLGADVPASVKTELHRAGAMTIEAAREWPSIPPAMWRFLVHDLPDSGRYLVRDADCRINQRERAAVAEWLASGRRFHVMRDHVVHFDLILAGLWGGTAGGGFVMAERITAFLARPGQDRRYGSDQAFLGKLIWPLIRADVLSHDSHYLVGETRPFPPVADAGGGDHVGAGFTLAGYLG